MMYRDAVSLISLSGGLDFPGSPVARQHVVSVVSR